jgi:three-Cys-motif partner protein
MSRRPRDIPDDDDAKWEYPEHTGAKHEILGRYLGAWLTILGRGRRGSTWRHKRLILLDGFAGRGRYVAGQPGSPAIMFYEAAKVADAGHAEEVVIGCSEPNELNFGHLKEVCDSLEHDRVRIVPKQRTFQESADRLIEWLKKQDPSPPTFVMVDPYGVRGVRLDTLRELLTFDRLEILLTFMVRDPARFLKEENYAAPLTELFGGDTWRECEESENRPVCLMLRFREVVMPGVAEYTIPFRVFEDEKRTPLYYLIHMTNNDLGMRKMKEVMVRKSGSMTFWPVTVEDPNQITLDEFTAEQRPYPTLQKRLARKYAGRSMTFLELLNDDYPWDVWVEPQYREALLGMAADDPARVQIERQGLTARLRKPRTRGLKYEDRVTFPSVASRS